MKKYLISISVASTLFIIFSIYNSSLYHYYNLYIANKTLADVAVIMLAFVVLIGPVSRLFSFPDRLLQYRKEVGITSFFFALSHAIISFFFLRDYFPLSRFLGQINFPFIFALTATLILIILFIFSFNHFINKWGRANWWRLQYLGVRIVFIFVFLHFFLLEAKEFFFEYEKKIRQLNFNFNLPKINVLIFWFYLFVIIFRLAEFKSQHLGRTVFYIGLIFLFLVYFFSFLF